LEYQRILAAEAYLKRMAAVQGSMRPDAAMNERVEAGIALDLGAVD
jgi:hypothetical protein